MAATPTSPATRAARHARIAHLVTAVPVRSQAQLAELLAAEGVAVTQATLSRDLDDLGAAKVRDADGSLRYAVDAEAGPASEERVRRVLGDLLLSVEASANLAVVRTPPGGAHLVGSVIDRAGIAGVLGTVAGDDTVLVVTRTQRGGADLVRRLVRLADR